MSDILRKVCCRCQANLPKGLFSKDNSRKDGLQPRCKLCQRKSKESAVKRFKKFWDHHDPRFWIKEKVCSKCKTKKLSDSFSKCSESKDGLLSHCKSCEYVRIHSWLREDFKLKSPPEGECPVCKKKSKLCYDHCHSSGNFRGYICHSCNLVLGKVNDSVEILESLISYLRTAGRD